MKKIILILGLLLIAPLSFAAGSLFSDISGDEWYASAVQSLNDKEIIWGYEDGTFRPSGNVNRAELATLLNRLILHIEPINYFTNHFNIMGTDEVLRIDDIENYTEQNGRYRMSFELRDTNDNVMQMDFELSKKLTNFPVTLDLAYDNIGDGLDYGITRFYYPIYGEGNSDPPPACGHIEDRFGITKGGTLKINYITYYKSGQIESINGSLTAHFHDCDLMGGSNGARGDIAIRGTFNKKVNNLVDGYIL